MIQSELECYKPCSLTDITQGKFYDWFLKVQLYTNSVSLSAKQPPANVIYLFSDAPSYEFDKNVILTTLFWSIFSLYFMEKISSGIIGNLLQILILNNVVNKVNFNYQSLIRASLNFTCG